MSGSDDNEPQIDWLRVGHRCLSFLRGLRGDGEAADDDTAIERMRATKLTTSIEAFAREQAGCKAPAACDCALCLRASMDDD